MEKAVIEYLSKNEVFHMSMLFPIRRGTAEILYADGDGVLLRETESNVYMLSVSNVETGKKLIDSISDNALFCVHQQYMANYINAKFNYKHQLICFCAVYPHKQPIKTSASQLLIKKLEVEYTDEIYNHYHEEADYAYIKSRIAKGKIFGGFINGELCGFIGTHEEGSIGILMVLPQYRHRGFAEELICYMINNILDKGQIPYSQISIDNEISIKLHKKLSFEISTDILYWFF